MPLPGGDLLKYVLGGAVGGERWTVSMWYRLIGLTSAPTAAQMNTTATGYLTGFTTTCWSATSTLKTWTTTDTSIDSCHLYLYRGGALVEQGVGVQAPVLGNSANPHPGYCALVTTLLTGSSGRSRRGRWYWPATGISINGATSQVTSAAILSGVVDPLAAFVTSQSIGQPAWPGTPGQAGVVVSPKLGVSTDITSIRCDSLPDTQHGRTRRLVAQFVATHAV